MIPSKTMIETALLKEDGRLFLALMQLATVMAPNSKDHSKSPGWLIFQLQDMSDQALDELFEENGIYLEDIRENLSFPLTSSEE